MKVAFTDKNGGYYEAIVANAEDVPEWAVGMTPCALLEPAFDPKDATRAQINQKLVAAGVTQDWHLDAMMAGMVALAVTQGLTEAQLYAVNPGYKQVKDVAEEIKTLRAAL